MKSKSALEYALKLLGYRARTEKELRERLRDKKYQPEEIDVVLAKLAKIGFVDDQKFAENYVRDKLSISRRGPRRIYFELIKHGVAKEIAEQATKAIEKEEELATAQSLLRSRQRQWAKLEPQAKKRRAIGLLARRGFSSDLIFLLIKTID
ncbi:MAG: regulatory protein RecX [Patescibacteria group bacterium]